MKRFAVAILLAVALVIAGCTPIERTAYNTTVGAKAFLDSEKKAHPECAFPASGPSVNVTITWCSNINKGIASKDLLIDAIEVYCAGPDFSTGTGACNAPAKGTPGATQAAAKLQAAIDAYNQVAADIKAVK
jgi:hypothetical protein